MSITVKATAINENGVRHIGIIREEKFNKSGYPNPLALQNAVSKAQRNAKKGLLSMTWVRDLIKQATGGMPKITTATNAVKSKGSPKKMKSSERKSREMKMSEHPIAIEVKIIRCCNKS